MTLRVLHVIPSVSPARGGPSKAIVEMVNALNQVGVHTEIATTDDDVQSVLDVDLNSLSERDGAPTRYFARWSPPIAALREFQFSWAFTRWLQNHIRDYDLIHVHAIFSYCSTYTMWLAGKTGVPYVVRPIGQLQPWSLQQGEYKKALYLRLIELRNLRQAGALHYTAKTEQQQSQASFEMATGRVIPLGVGRCMPLRDASVKLRKRFKLHQSAPIIASVSRLHPKKGIDLMLTALAEVETPWELVIAGDGEPEFLQQLREKIAYLGLQKRIHMVGFLKGPEKNLLLQGCDLFALTSHSENFGIAVLEALNVGTPVLVSDAVALSVGIAENNLGYVTLLDKESIANAFREALQDIEDGEINKAEIQEYVAKNYRWRHIAKQLQALYQDMLKR